MIARRMSRFEAAAMRLASGSGSANPSFFATAASRSLIYTYSEARWKTLADAGMCLEKV